MKIKIGKKNIELKYTIRAMIMYENMAQKSFNPQTLTDIITFMYCIIVSSSKDYSFKFDQFIDYLDEHPEIMTEFSEWITSNANTNSDLSKN